MSDSGCEGEKGGGEECVDENEGAGAGISEPWGVGSIDGGSTTGVANLL